MFRYNVNFKTQACCGTVEKKNWTGKPTCVLICITGIFMHAL